jgi:hypothetical protein
MRINRSGSSDLATNAAELGRMDLRLVFVPALPQALGVRRANPDMAMVIATCPNAECPQ